MVMSRPFIIKSKPYHNEDWTAWFRLYVYETAEGLRRAATRYTRNDTKFVDTLACFQPSFSARWPGPGEKGLQRSPKTSYLGVMRLTTEHCNPAIVVHECVHAAVAYVRALKLKPDYFHLGSNIETEEALAHAVHEFSMAVLYCMGYHDEIVRAS